VIQVDEKAGAALVELPIEADSGRHRIWFKLSDMRNLPEGVAS